MFLPFNPSPRKSNKAQASSGRRYIPLPAAALAAGPAKLENSNLYIFYKIQSTGADRYTTGPLTHLSPGQVGLVRQLVHEEVVELQCLLVAKGGVPPAHACGIEASETRGGGGASASFPIRNKAFKYYIVCFESYILYNYIFCSQGASLES